MGSARSLAHRSQLPPDLVDYVGAALEAADEGQPLLLYGWEV